MSKEQSIEEQLKQKFEEIARCKIPTLSKYIESDNLLALSFNEAISLMQSAYKLDRSEQSKWIPVAERLPDEGQEVNVLRNGRVSIALFDEDIQGVLCWSSINWQDDLGDFNDEGKYKITHWQPLPSPPKQ